MARMSSIVRLVCMVVCLSACTKPEDVALGTLERDLVLGRAVASQPVIAIYVTEGQSVKQGQLLLELDASVSDAKIAALSAKVDQANFALKSLKLGYRDEQIASAKAELIAASRNRESAQAELSRQQSLQTRQLASKKALDLADNSLSSATATEEAALERLRLLQKGYRSEDIMQSASALAAAKAELEYERAQINQLKIVATRNGVVDSLPFKIGDRPPINAAVVSVLADSQPWARVYIPEPYIAKIAVGDLFPVVIDGVTQQFTGKLQFVSSKASYTPYFALSESNRRSLSFVAHLELTDDAAQSLPTGVPVQVLLPNE